MKAELFSYNGPIKGNNLIPSSIEMDDILYREIEAACKTARIFDPYSIVAGGCLRDPVFGKKVNDIDVYLNCSGTYPERVMNEIVRGLGYIPYIINKHPAYGHNPRIQGVVTCTKDGLKYPVQFIFMIPHSSTFNEVSKFHINISKFWCQHPSKIRFNRDLLKFMETGIISRTAGLEINEAYVDKIRAKYPEFKWEEAPIPVVIPEDDPFEERDLDFPRRVARAADMFIVDDLHPRNDRVDQVGQILPEFMFWNNRGV